jgi:2'-5' RNA ligase
MGFAVELALDSTFGERVSLLWDQISGQCGGANPRDLGVRPHISLAVLEQADPGTLRTPLAEFAASCLPIPVQFSSVGAFPTAEGVVFLAPVVTLDLLAVHRRFHDLLQSLGHMSIGYYRPEVWVPHCTVGQDVPADKVALATDLARTSSLFGSATLVELALLEFRPVRYLYCFALA